jgi:hypothetical protein
MAKRHRIPPRIQMGLLLASLSVLVYAVHYAVFRDAHHIFIYLLGDVGFLFIEVLLVTLIIHQILSEREKRSLLRKLNMVIGAFFSEVGTPLLKRFIGFDRNAGTLSKRLLIDGRWSDERFDQMQHVLAEHEYQIDTQVGDLAGLRDFVVEKRTFLLGLLENPNLLEHEAFTELLWAVFHLAEELSHRPRVDDLPTPDHQHLGLDIKRASSLLVREWLSHMEHLKADYPYLFSLAVRTNPFDPNASVELA